MALSLGEIVKHLMQNHKPDLVLSGVNSGANLAKDVTTQARWGQRYRPAC